jgi:putative ABC transport system permease protein
MVTREPVHDRGRIEGGRDDTAADIIMVTCWVVAPAIIALPAGMITQDVTVRKLSSDIGLPIPDSFMHVHGTTQLFPLALAGLAIAIAGALGPATWAATAKTTTALRAEQPIGCGRRLGRSCSPGVHNGADGAVRRRLRSSFSVKAEAR